MRGEVDRELSGISGVTLTVVAPARSLLLLPMCLAGCQAWSYARAEADWKTLQAADDDNAKIAAARELVQDDTTTLAGTMAESIGAFRGSDAEAYVGVAVAKVRPNGMRWLAERIYGASLDEAFADVLTHEALAGGRLDWGALADGLLIGASGNAEADRWLALMAMSDDGDSSTRVRQALSEDLTRYRIRTALSRAEMPRSLPAPLLQAFGGPRDDTESAWLTTRYQASFADAIDDRPIGDNGAYDDLKAAWDVAFPGRLVPLAADDREIMRVLKPLLAPDDAPDVPPSFVDMASFMTRHGRTDWATLVKIYADGDALPSDALSYVCRTSSAECQQVLLLGYARDVATASDVVPALDLDDGDAALVVACRELPPDEARLLSSRALAAGMPLRVREAAASCLMTLGDDASEIWKSLLPEAIGARDWTDAEVVAVTSPDSVDDGTRNDIMALVASGQVRAIDVPWLLVGSEAGADMLRQSILAEDPTAFDGLGPEISGPYMVPIAEHLSAPNHGAIRIPVDIY